jgi:hypothetical protein
VDFLEVLSPDPVVDFLEVLSPDPLVVDLGLGVFRAALAGDFSPAVLVDFLDAGVVDLPSVASIPDC